MPRCIHQLQQVLFLCEIVAVTLAAVVVIAAAVAIAVEVVIAPAIVGGGGVVDCQLLMEK